LIDLLLVNAGAIAKITCVAIDENGYETAPFSTLTNGCDENGYFFATLSGLKDNWKLKECKVFQYYSPLETCKVPIDANQGLSGDLLSSYRTLFAYICCFELYFILFFIISSFQINSLF